MDDRLTGYATENVAPLTADERAEYHALVWTVVESAYPLDGACPGPDGLRLAETDLSRIAWIGLPAECE